MELSLNLIWLTLAIGAMAILVRARHRRVESIRVPFHASVIALTCIVLLLFPVVSASDDLHPAQAVVEDAQKRVSLAAPVHLLRITPAAPVLPFNLALYVALVALVVWPWHTASLTARTLDGVSLASAERGPPIRRH